MTIEIRTEAEGFINKSFPEATADIDLELSLRNFEQLLKTELNKVYPTADIAVRVTNSRGTTIYLNHEDIASTDQPDAIGVYTNIRYAMDKLFFYGRFWEDKQPGSEP
jgi:hypothetical protein